jgi:hypothetical protein
VFGGYNEILVLQADVQVQCELLERMLLVPIERMLGLLDSLFTGKTNQRYPRECVTPTGRWSAVGSVPAMAQMPERQGHIG